MAASHTEHAEGGPTTTMFPLSNLRQEPSWPGPELMCPNPRCSPIDILSPPHSSDLDSDDENNQISFNTNDRCSHNHGLETSNKNVFCNSISSPPIVLSSFPSCLSGTSGENRHQRQEITSGFAVERIVAYDKPTEPIATFDGTVYREPIKFKRHEEDTKATPSLIPSSSGYGSFSDDEDMDSPGPETPTQSITYYSYTLAESQKLQAGKLSVPLGLNCDLVSDGSSPGAMDQLSFPSSSSYIASPDLPQVYVPPMSKKKWVNQDVSQMMKPRNSMPGATARLRSSLSQESRQRVADGLGVTGKVVSKNHSDFISRLIPSKLLQIETGASGWAGRIFTQLAEWILTVTPDEESSLDLADHLVESPETRFTALILLCRYMKRVGLFDRRVVQSHKERGANERRIKEDVLWESAVACLALSVKISSDAWAPRRPILSVSFQMLGSSFIPFSELETAQWDIISCLENDISCITPPMFIEDLADIVPSLASAANTKYRWGYVHELAQQTVAAVISDANLILRYPVSTITAACLYRALYQMFMEDTCLEHDPISRQTQLQAALVTLESIMLDVRQALGMPEADWWSCSGLVASAFNQQIATY